MGFRFRRTVKLFPGVRLNIGKQGISYSVGVPGAQLTFSKRGARTTFGIPGTGLFFTQSTKGLRESHYPSQGSFTPESSSRIQTIEEFDAALQDERAMLVYSHSGRRLSTQQLEAARNRLLNKKRRELANVQVADAEQKQRDIINCWREAPDIPSEEEYNAACFQKPFEFNEPAPIALNELEERRKFTNRLKKDVEWKYPLPMGKRIYGYGIGVAVGILSGAIVKVFLPLLHISGPILVGLLLGLGAAGIVNKILGDQWNIHLQNLTEELFRREWPKHWEKLVTDYKAAVDTFESQRAEAKALWERDEIERTTWAKRLIAGDVEAIKDSVADTISDLDFPFDAQCDVALSNAELVYLHLDLPEVEDVIPETRSSVLKDGRIKQVKRSATERYGEYSHLVSGLAILLACAAFSAGPTLKTTWVAAYTQRKKRGTDAIIDNYVYEVSLERAKIETLALGELDPISFFSTIGAKFEQKNTLELKALPAPVWVVDFANK